MGRMNTEHTAFFSLDSAGSYEPTEYARSAWSPTMLNGPSVVAAAARSLEREQGGGDFLPARLTVDLFAPVRFAPLEVSTEAVRAGRRIRVADARVIQEGQTVARATLVMLRLGEQPAGEVWTAPREVGFPRQLADESLASDAHHYFVGDPEDPDRWSRDMGDHQNNRRKRVWNHPRDVVEGDRATPFQRAATLAESTSLATNWGTDGIGFINADVTVALSRLPRSEDLGLEADQHLSTNGVAVGTATLYDREGPFGTGTVVAVANGGQRIDFGE